MLTPTRAVIKLADAAGEFFGLDRLVDLLTRQEAAGQPPPPPLRQPHHTPSWTISTWAAGRRHPAATRMGRRLDRHHRRVRAVASPARGSWWLQVQERLMGEGCRTGDVTSQTAAPGVAAYDEGMPPCTCTSSV